MGQLTSSGVYEPQVGGGAHRAATGTAAVSSRAASPVRAAFEGSWLSREEISRAARIAAPFAVALRYFATRDAYAVPGDGTYAWKRRRQGVIAVTAEGSATPTGEDVEMWTVRGLIAAHKAAALVAAAGCALMVAIVLLAVFGAKAGAVSDSTTCTQWGSSNVVRQDAYARLYVKEHGPIPGSGTSPAVVIGAINIVCLEAYNEDVSDSTTIVQALSGAF